MQTRQPAFGKAGCRVCLSIFGLFLCGTFFAGLVGALLLAILAVLAILVAFFLAVLLVALFALGAILLTVFLEGALCTHSEAEDGRHGQS